MNQLLEKQIKKYLKKIKKIPKDFNNLFSVISNTYDDFDQDRNLIERSLEISSKEHILLNKSLKEERDKSQEFLDIAGVILIALNKEGVITMINRKGCEILEYEENEILGKNWFDYFLPRKIRNTIKKIIKLLLNGKIKIGENYENIVLTKSGKEKLIAWHNTIIRNKEGKIIGTLSSGEDITERRRAENAVQKNLSLISATLESTADGILVVNKQGKWSNYNKKFLEMWRIPKDIIESKNDKLALDYVTTQLKNPNSFITKVKNLYNKPRTNDFDIIEFKDGRAFERYSQAQILEGKVVGRVWSFRDITERKKTEHALKTSEERYRAITKQTGQIIYDYNVETGQIDWFGDMNKITGYSKNEIKNFNIDKWKEAIHPNDKKYALQKLDKAMKTVGGYEINYKFRIKSGEYINIEDTGIFISNGKNKKATRMYGAMKDITEKTKTERRLKNLIESSPVGIYQTNKKGEYLYVNKKWTEISGVPIKKAIGKGWENGIHIKDRKKITDTFYSAIKNGENFKLEYRFKSAGKPIKWVEGSAIQTKDNYGEIIGYLGTIMDITERKKAEQEIKNNEKKLKDQIEKMEFIGRVNLKRHKEMLDMKKEVKRLQNKLKNSF